MRCAECGAEMLETSGPFAGSIRGEQYTVSGIKRLQCPGCGNYEFNLPEAERLTSALWSLYRTAHDIPSKEEIAALRSDLGLTQQEFGRLVEANVQTVSRWENGRVVPDARAGRLMWLLKTVPEARAAMLERCELRQNASNVAFPVSSGSNVPLYSLGCLRSDNSSDASAPPQSIEVPQSVLDRHPEAFAVTVEGDFMSNVLLDGYHALVDPQVKPRNGSVVVVKTADQTVVCRWYKFKSLLVLETDSSDPHDDIVLDSAETVTVLGTVVWCQSSRELE
jgi:putative zinc finger/helix-turn-helix YgiT family protein